MVNESSNINEKNIRNEKFHPKQFNTEYTKKFRPFSQYDHQEIENRNQDKDETRNEQEKLIEIRENGPNLLSNKNVSGWFKEVVELRKKAGQYKVCTIVIKTKKILQNIKKIVLQIVFLVNIIIS